MKKVITVLILAAFVILAIRLTAGNDAGATVPDTGNTAGRISAAEQEDPQADISTAKDYAQYLEENDDVPMGTADVSVPFAQLKASDGAYQVEDDDIRIGEDGYIDIPVDIPQPGLYEIELTYMPAPGRSAPVEIVAQVDHEIPYRQAETILLERIWQDKTTESEVDPNGNDICPSQVEEAVWSTKRLEDSTGFFVQPLLFYCEQGENTVTITVNRETVLLRELSVCAPRSVPAYSAYIAGFSDKPPATANAAHIQAEQPAWKSDPTLVRSFDRTSPLTEPYKGSKISLNIIGGNTWCKTGETIAWTFDAPQDALYEIRFKVKQNFIRGTYSGRTLRIDGEIPFTEAENIKFIYDSRWQIVTLGDGDAPYYVYLTKGEHELSMEVTLGDLGETLNKVDTCARDINGIYRKFLMIMGYTPDIMRDYKLERQLPEVFTLMSDVADRLDEVVDEMTALTGTKGTELLSLSEMSRTLRDFVKKPYEIPEKFGVFTSDMSALNAWKNDASIRPLEMDYIDIAAPGSPLPRVNPTFFQSVSYGVDMFIASFVEDYNSLGSTSDSNRSITVWSTTGRDQAQVLNQLIKTSFAGQSDVNVEIQLVPGDIILPSTVAGNGPDVILYAGQQLPVNYAIRGAAVDLSQFNGFDEVASNFRESAITPARFNGGVYGLPETETFPMLFYRRDVLDELGIELPDTWDDVLKIIPVLQKNNMSFLMDTGIANTSDPNYAGGTDANTALDIYATLLYQRGGQIYEGDGIRTQLDGELAIETFKDWCKLYTNYGLPTNFNAAYRFRTGESPLIVANMALYNTLMLSAPEIKGMWGMTSVPGTVDADGNINRSVRTKTSYTVITKTSKDKEAAWEFIKWWLSADAQEQYARDLESLMGTAARYMTANTVAFSRLPWATKDLDAILAQGDWTIGVPEVAGGYFLPRHINNAFRSVVIDKAEPRETLIDYAHTINEELTDKRREFGLPVYQE
jgi:ABC-type glycerol-3-phosphate transport system substrate-binding protein